MSSPGKFPVLVFFDLSSLDQAALESILEELSLRQSQGAFPDRAPCHWVVDPRQFAKLLTQDTPSARFVRDRDQKGDAFFPVNLSGQDWNHLFPDEALRDAEETAAVFGTDIPVFLKETAHRPPWLAQVPYQVLLWEKHREEKVLLAVSRGEARSLPLGSDGEGVRWIVPAQILLAALPPLPWTSLGSLQDDFKPHPHPEPAGLTPADKIRIHKTAELRREAPAKYSLKNIFSVNSEFPGLGTKEAVDFEETLGGIRKRALVASTQGTSDMREAGLAVRFQGGHLQRILGAKEEVLCTSAASYLEWKGKRRTFRTNSAFTLAGDFSFGLRESLVLEDPDLAEPARMIIDYYFVEDSPEFFASVTVRWPRWKVPGPVSAWAPLELGLFPLKDRKALTCRTLWPDGKSDDVLLDTKKGQGLLSGTNFLFSCGETALVLGFPQNQTPRPHRLSWRLGKEGSQKVLFVNPEGGTGPRPCEEWEGIEEHFSFYLALPQESRLPFLVTRKQASELIPPYIKPDETPAP